MKRKNNNTELEKRLSNINTDVLVLTDELKRYRQEAEDKIKYKPDATLIILVAVFILLLFPMIFISGVFRPFYRLTQMHKKEVQQNPKYHINGVFNELEYVMGI